MRDSNLRTGAGLRIVRGAAALAITLAVNAGCGRVVNRTVERRIRESLPARIGPAKEYRVHVSGSEENTLRGRLSDVTVDGDEVQLKSGLVLDSLNIDLKDINVDVKHRQLREIRDSSFHVVVRDSDLDRYFAARSSEHDKFRNAHITFGEGNSLTLKGERVVKGNGIPFTATGSLKILDPQHAGVNLDTLSIVDNPVEGAELENFKSRLDKAIDLSTLPISITLTHIGTAPGKLTLEGKADLTAEAQREWQKQ